MEKQLKCAGYNRRSSRCRKLTSEKDKLRTVIRGSHAPRTVLASVRLTLLASVVRHRRGGKGENVNARHVKLPEEAARPSVFIGVIGFSIAGMRPRVA
jgi:hypothetical protein